MEAMTHFALSEVLIDVAFLLLLPVPAGERANSIRPASRPQIEDAAPPGNSAKQKAHPSLPLVTSKISPRGPMTSAPASKSERPIPARSIRSIDPVTPDNGRYAGMTGSSR
jgi:hypothetical protein